MTTETRVSIAVALPVATSAIPLFAETIVPIVISRLRMRHVTEIRVFVEVALPVTMGERNCGCSGWGSGGRASAIQPLTEAQLHIVSVSFSIPNPVEFMVGPVEFMEGVVVVDVALPVAMGNRRVYWAPRHAKHHSSKTANFSTRHRFHVGSC
jgi:sterol desaturase/sphingolipid hydroxylase (fatty acid hydroxylase superfamily)